MSQKKFKFLLQNLSINIFSIFIFEYDRFRLNFLLYIFCIHNFLIYYYLFLEFCFSFYHYSIFFSHDNKVIKITFQVFILFFLIICFFLFWSLFSSLHIFSMFSFLFSLLYILIHIFYSFLTLQYVGSPFLSDPLPILYLGLFTTGVCNYLQTIGQKDISAEKAAVIYSMDPVYGGNYIDFILICCTFVRVF